LNSIGTANTVSGITFDSDINSFAVITQGSASLDLSNTGSGINAMTMGPGMETLSITTNQSASFTWDNAGTGITVNGGSALTALTLSANGGESADIVMTSADFTLQADSVITLDANDKADITVDSFLLGNGSSGNSSITLNLANAKDSTVTVDDITVSANGSVNIVFGDNAKSGGFVVDDIDVIRGDASGQANLNVDFGGAMAASANIGIIDLSSAGTGATVNLDNVTLASGGFVTMGNIVGTGSHAINVDSIAITAGTSAAFAVGAVTVSNGSFAGIEFTGQGNGSSATFGAVMASTIGATNINLASGGDVTIASYSAAQTIGAIEINGEDNSTVTITAGMKASGIGAVSVSGAPTVNLGTAVGTFGGIDASAMTKSGSFTIDLSDVTNAVEVNLGAATNSVVSGQGDDVITLTAGTTGNDTIKFTTAGLGIDQIANFGSNDTLALFTGGGSWSFINGSHTASEASGAMQLHASAGAITMATADQGIVLTSAVSSTADMISSLKANVTFVSAVASGALGDLVVVWTDGSDTYVSLAQLSAATTSTGSTASFASAGVSAVVSDTTIAVVTGVTPEAVAGNIDLF
jgi:hypothetical protein